MILFNKSRLKGSAATLNNRKRLYDPMSLAGAADYSEKESDRLRAGRLTIIEDFALEHSHYSQHFESIGVAGDF